MVSKLFTHFLICHPSKILAFPILLFCSNYRAMFQRLGNTRQIRLFFFVLFVKGEMGTASMTQHTLRQQFSNPYIIEGVYRNYWIASQYIGFTLLNFLRSIFIFEINTRLTLWRMVLDAQGKRHFNWAKLVTSILED